MKKFLLTFLIFTALTAPGFGAWPARTDIVENNLGKSLTLITATAKTLFGSESNAGWATLSGDSFSNTLTTILAPSYVTPSSSGAGYVTIHANVAVEGLPSAVYYAITKTPKDTAITNLADAFVNTLNVYLTDLPNDVHYAITKTPKPIITFWHNEQHEGGAFRFGEFDADTDSKVWNLVVPNGVTAHVRIGVTTGDGSLTINAYSGAVFAGGTTMTAKPVNIVTGGTPNVKMYNGYAITDLSGTLVSLFPADNLVGTGATGGGAGKIGGTIQAGDEDSLIFPAGSYAIIVNALSATVLSTVTIEFYEHGL